MIVLIHCFKIQNQIGNAKYTHADDVSWPVLMLELIGRVASMLLQEREADTAGGVGALFSSWGMAHRNFIFYLFNHLCV